MYQGAANQGMRNIHGLLERYSLENRVSISKKVFDVRTKNELPGREFDAYISTGGPGSPVDAEGWEENYMTLIVDIIKHNQKSKKKKYVFFICHSFQVICYHFKLGAVCPRKKETFGIFPVHKTHKADENNITKNLNEPFYAVDSRKWQVIQPNYNNLAKMGAKILAIEKERSHIPLERATMAIQFTPEIFGTQFHPEAGAQGMIHYLETTEKKKIVIENYGMERYNDMLYHLHDPDKILLTQRIIIPSFLDQALQPLNIKTT